MADATPAVIQVPALGRPAVIMVMETVFVRGMARAIHLHVAIVRLALVSTTATIHPPTLLVPTEAITVAALVASPVAGT